MVSSTRMLKLQCRQKVYIFRVKKSFKIIGRKLSRPCRGILNHIFSSCYVVSYFIWHSSMRVELIYILRIQRSRDQVAQFFFILF